MPDERDPNDLARDVGGKAPDDGGPISGTFVAAHFASPTHHPPEFGSAGLTGRWKLLGNSTALLVFLGVFLVTLYVVLGFIREDRLELRRTTQVQFENLERRVDNCERRHAERDVEETRERQRQFEDRQAATRERQQAIGQLELLDKKLASLTAMLGKLAAKLPDPPKDG